MKKEFFLVVFGRADGIAKRKKRYQCDTKTH